VHKLRHSIYPNVADLHRGKTSQSAPDVAEHSLGQVVAYLTVCEILANASTGADGVLWCERSGFCRCGFATLGFMLNSKRCFHISIIFSNCKIDNLLIIEGIER